MEARRFYGWQVVGALWVAVFVNVGFTSFGGGVINALMARELSLERSVLGLGYTSFMIVMGFSAPAVAWSLKRFGARMTACFGSLTIVAGALLLAHTVTQAWQYIAAFGLVLGLGSGFAGSMVAQACITQWFERKRGLAISIALAATGVGGFIAPPLLNKIVTAYDGNWRAGWDFVAALALVTCLVSLFFIKNRPADYGQVPDGKVDGEACAGTAGSKLARIHRSAHDWPVVDALRTPAFWIIAMTAISAVLAISVFISHAIPHLRDLGHPVGIATLALGTIALSNIFGKLAAGFLCDRFEPRYVWCIASLLVASGVFLSIGADSDVEIYAFAACLGIGYGAALVCWPSMVANYFGAGAFPGMFGVQMPITTAVASLAPYFVGLMYDLQGSYSEAFIAIASLAIVCAVLVVITMPPRLASERYGMA